MCLQPASAKGWTPIYTLTSSLQTHAPVAWSADLDLHAFDRFAAIDDGAVAARAVFVCRRIIFLAAGELILLDQLKPGRVRE